jgi:hypothetical protein
VTDLGNCIGGPGDMGDMTGCIWDELRLTFKSW